jgi:hypothetical protein
MVLDSLSVCTNANVAYNSCYVLVCLFTLDFSYAKYFWENYSEKLCYMIKMQLKVYIIF